ncbi:transporter [Vespertiliibacter pulmonis]|uniref:Sodium-dependent dicarboxylate transporter 2/3/5 n=1 Tax=Vespertiliibacter pulmonis TaxID=1443036 RepID=A0A3N4WK61_9PAST|nr:SLC13 family permease [Vespertiliibacter pulmonis]QLB20334.1 transporter [Vespertiliibacter pulmonis]RPE86320.1 sodium-dependent dicarboxylate transporter 2/3/5 [Vespertiliibacter pulmonis]
MPNRRGYFILSISLAIFFLLLNILPFSLKENKGLALLVFVAILWLTEAFHITMTALLVPIFAIFLGVLSTEAAFAPFSKPIIFMFFGGFVIAAVLRIQKIDMWIAGHIIRLAKGSLKLTIIYLFTATAFLSMFINNTAVAAMMLPLTLGILSKIEVEGNRNLYVFVLLGIAFSSSIGGIGTLVGSTPNALLALLTDVTFSEWLPYGMPVMLLLMPAMIFSLWIVLKPNFNVPFTSSVEDVSLTGIRLFTLVVFILTSILLILSKFIEPHLRLFFDIPNQIKNFDSVIAMIAVVVLGMSGTATWKQIQEKTEWGVLMLFGGGLVLSIVLKDTGASKILADTIVSFVGDKHWLFMTVILTSFIVFLTEFTSNTASAALLMPIFISVANSLNLPVLSLAAIIATGASCAFMLPIATPPNAIVFSTGFIKQKEMAKVGLLLNVICIMVIGGLSYFCWINW